MAPGLAPHRAARESRPTPNLFVVGAPKSGTTALGTYLGRHPDLFVAGKELSYFGSDLEFLTDTGGRWHIGYDAYLEWFAHRDAVRYRCDRSVFYLYSRRAAEEIHDFDPGATVVALLRNPVDQMHSQHSEMVFQGEEDLTSFADALDAEEARRRGERVPPGCHKAFGLLYRDIARYADQVERYRTRFGERLCVVLHDDLVADAAATYRRVLEFLDVDPGHRPDFDVVNANKVVRSPLLRRMLRLRQAPSPLRRLGRLVVPDERARADLRRRLHRLNTKAVARPAMDPALRRRLVEEFTPEVRRLETLLQRDLGSWLDPDPPARRSRPTSTGASPTGAGPTATAGPGAPGAGG